MQPTTNKYTLNDVHYIKVSYSIKKFGRLVYESFGEKNQTDLLFNRTCFLVGVILLVLMKLLFDNSAKRGQSRSSTIYKAVIRTFVRYSINVKHFICTLLLN